MRLLREFFLFIGASVLSLSLLLIVLDKFIMLKITRHDQVVKVPDITEKPINEARKVLQNRGLQLYVDKWQKSLRVPKGNVISQNPRAFSQVKKGRHIYVVLSKGHRLHQVPDVRGVSVRQAKLKLEQEGLKVGTVTKKPSAEFPEGVVSSQIPSPGDKVREGVVVNLFVSSGSKVEKLTMPNLVGKSLENALKTLRELGLGVGQIKYSKSSDYLPETVLTQSVEPGKRVAKSIKIDLIVSKL